LDLTFFNTHPMKQRITIILLCLVIVAGCATKRDLVFLEDRVSEIEKYRIEALKEQAITESRIQDLDRSQDNVDQGAKTKYAGIKSEVSGLKQEVRTLSGRIDELHHMLEQLTNSLKKLETGIDRLDEKTTSHTDRIIRLEEYLGFEQHRSTPGISGNTAPVKKVIPANDLYGTAKQAFDKNKFEPARIGFHQFVSKYPDSENADNALFWIGETYFREKNYKKAILEYQKVIEKYPKGNKVSAALLKQGLAFNHIGEGSNAKLILNELTRRFPKSKEADIARTNLKKIK
jgi:tol-pal system protein YbgF